MSAVGYNGVSSTKEKKGEIAELNWTYEKIPLFLDDTQVSSVIGIGGWICEVLEWSFRLVELVGFSSLVLVVPFSYFFLLYNILRFGSVDDTCSYRMHAFHFFASLVASVKTLFLCSHTVRN